MQTDIKIIKNIKQCNNNDILFDKRNNMYFKINLIGKENILFFHKNIEKSTTIDNFLSCNFIKLNDIKKEKLLIKKIDLYEKEYIRELRKKINFNKKIKVFVVNKK
jgi:hypothetical protein